MTETKSKKVTFDDSLPRGTVGTFTHDGEMWFAYPQKKVSEIGVVLDRAVGVIERVHDDLVAWINDHPEDAVRVVHIMARTMRFKELSSEKARAWTIQRERTDEAENPTQEKVTVDSAGGDTGEAGTGA